MAATNTTARRPTTRKSTTKKSTTKNSNAKKSTARRATTKKSITRKSTAKTTARRPAPKKRVATKTTARKSTAKKSTARKSTAKRTTSIRPRRTTSPAANKRVVSAIEIAWNTGDLSALDEHFARGYRNHAAMPGMETDLRAAKNTHAMVIQAFPDRNVELLDIVAEGDRVAIRTRVTGTNHGGALWFGAPANDRSIDFESWALYRLEGAKVVESWGLNDGLAALVQLGTWEPPQRPDEARDRDQDRMLSLVGAE